MFRTWNPDPVGNHDANIRALNPLLARVIRKTQADNPDLPFVIGSMLAGVSGVLYTVFGYFAMVLSQ